MPKESWGHEVCERKKNVVFVGSLIPRKNVDMLIQAFLECNELYDSLDIIGDGPLNNSLKKKYAEESKVNFIGQTKKAQCFIRQAYLVVVPSNRDPYPNVALEAISESTVIIGNNVPGVRDILLYNDLLFSDKKTLVEKLTMISNSLEYHSKLKDRVVKRKDDLSFDWDAEVSKIIENCS
nr:glycosyltransferase family 4 protein [Halomonas sp. OfavH-34-E]